MFCLHGSKRLCRRDLFFSQLIQTANDINLEFYSILHSIQTISNTKLPPTQVSNSYWRNLKWALIWCLEYLKKQLTVTAVCLGYFHCALFMISTINSEATSHNYRMASYLRASIFPSLQLLVFTYLVRVCNSMCEECWLWAFRVLSSRVEYYMLCRVRSSLCTCKPKQLER